ncbi:MAG: hypothetical protein WCG47_01015 [Dermatophilaceae bacterium]
MARVHVVLEGGHHHGQEAFFAVESLSARIVYEPDTRRHWPAETYVLTSNVLTLGDGRSAYVAECEQVRGLRRV